MIKEGAGEKIETLEQLMGKYRADDVAFITGMKEPRELLKEYMYDAFVKAR